MLLLLLLLLLLLSQGKSSIAPATTHHLYDSIALHCCMDPQVCQPHPSLPNATLRSIPLHSTPPMDSEIPHLPTAFVSPNSDHHSLQCHSSRTCHSCTAHRHAKPRLGVIDRTPRGLH
ncbi:hypothetical protein KC19_5G088400 [Ceratodon purpureus]|uniref:Secreted protein n=1 Tax=Ceratodon purpureus TaxID=3225 RepID=A0A8T0HZC3_CERPU|nr:hypothetical protein KC19_5G088400 [Ceratodon purpureus]